MSHLGGAHRKLVQPKRITDGGLGASVASSVRRPWRFGRKAGER